MPSALDYVRKHNGMMGFSSSAFSANPAPKAENKETMDFELLGKMQNLCALGLDIENAYQSTKLPEKTYSNFSSLLEEFYKNHALNLKDKDEVQLELNGLLALSATDDPEKMKRVKSLVSKSFFAFDIFAAGRIMSAVIFF